MDIKKLYQKSLGDAYVEPAAESNTQDPAIMELYKRSLGEDVETPVKFKPEVVSAPESSDYSDKEILAAIRNVESSGGANLQHKVIDKEGGMHQGTSAYANYGLMPVTMRDLIENYRKSELSDYKYLVKDLSDAINKEAKATTPEEKRAAREQVIAESEVLKNNIAKLDEGKAHEDTIEYKLASEYYNYLKSVLKDEIAEHGYKVIGYAWLNGPGNVKRLLAEKPEVVLNNYYPERMYEGYLRQVNEPTKELAPGVIAKPSEEKPGTMTSISIGGTKFQIPVPKLRELTDDEKMQLALRGIITPQEIKQIADKYGYSAPEDIEQLKNLATYFGANVPGHTAYVHAVVGLLGDSLAFGLPQKYTIEGFMDSARSESEKQMLDELRQLALSRKTPARIAGEVALGMAVPIGAAKTVKGSGLVGAGMGSIQGATYAPRGSELEGALTGLTFGGLLGLGIGKLAGKMSAGAKLAEEAKSLDEALAATTINRIINELPPQAKADLDGAARNYWTKRDNQYRHKAFIQVLEDATHTTKRGSTSSDIYTIDRFTDSLNKKPGMQAAFIDPTRLDALEQRIAKYNTATKAAKQVMLEGDDELYQVIEEGFTPKQVIAHRGFERYAKQLATSRGFKSGGELVKSAQEQGIEYYTKIDKSYREMVAMRDQMAKLPAGREVDFGELRTQFNKLIDGHIYARQVDQRFNTNLEPVFAEMSNRLKESEGFRITILKRVSELRKRAQKAGVDSEDLGRALHNKNSWVGDDGVRRSVNQEVYNEARDLLEDMRILANENYGANIPKLETDVLGYFPAKRKDTVDYILAIEPKYQAIIDNAELAELLTQNTKRAWNKAKKDSTVEYLTKEMEQLFGTKITSTEQFAKGLKDLMTPTKVREGLNTRATAMVHRSGDSSIPADVQQWDAFNTLTYWANNTLKHLALRDGMEEIAKVQKALSNRAPGVAEHLKLLRKDLAGVREDKLLSSIGKLEDKLDLTLRRTSNKLKEGGYTATAGAVDAIRYVPDIIRLLPKQVYASTLGGSIRTAQQNMLSAYLQSLPELGSEYGGEVLGRALKRSLKALVDGEELKLTGNMAAQLSPKAGDKIKLTSTDVFKLGLPEDRVGTSLLLDAKTAKQLELKAGDYYTTRNLDVIAQNYRLIGPQFQGEMERQLTDATKASTAWRVTNEGLESANNVLMFMFKKSEELARLQTRAIADEVSKDLLRNNPSAVKWLDKLSSPSFRRQIAEAVRGKESERVHELVAKYFDSSNMFNYDKVNLSAWGRWGGPALSTFTKWPAAMAGKVSNELIDRGGPGARKVLQQFLAPFAAMQTLDYALLPEPGKNPTVDIIFGRGQLSNMVGVSSLLDFVNFEQGLLHTPLGQSISEVSKAVKSDYEGAGSKAWQRVGSLYLPLSGYLRIIGDDLPKYSGQNPAIKYPHLGAIERRVAEAKRLGYNLEDIPPQLLKTLQDITTEPVKLWEDAEYRSDKAIRALNPFEKYKEIK